MSLAKAIFINPSPRTMSLVSPVVSHFYNILKMSDIEMKFFDTTFYDVSDKYINPDKKMSENYSVKEYKHDLPNDLEPSKTHDDLLRDFKREVETFRPDVILASSVESSIAFTRELLSHIREFNIPHVLGGVFATYAPELAINLPEVDIICVGEGDAILAQLVMNIKNGKDLSDIPSIWYKKKNGDISKKKMLPPVNLDELPRFDIAPFEDSRFYRAMSGKVYRMFPVETHRGCPFKCTFCNSPTQEEAYVRDTGTGYYRKRSISKVLEDVRYFVEECKAEYLFFWADYFFTYSQKEIDEFCEVYKKYKIPFYVQTYPASIDEYKIKKLYEVGLHRIGMGVEHGNEKFRKEIINRSYLNSTAIEKVKIFKKFDVEYSCNNIVGFPYETPELHRDTVMLNRSLDADSSSCAIFTPFQGTPLRKLAIKAGFLKDPNAYAPSNFDYSILDMPLFPKDQIAGKSRVFNLYIKFPESRWKDVERAEKLTPEGDRIFHELRQELNEKMKG